MACLSVIKFLLVLDPIPHQEKSHKHVHACVCDFFVLLDFHKSSSE